MLTGSGSAVQTGLDLIEREPGVLKCHNDTKRLQTWGLMGASRAIFRGGFSIDSFMLRYRGVDWLNQTNWDCNGRCGPVLWCPSQLGQI